MILAGNVLPTTNLIYNVGTAAIALNDIYADNFFNVSDQRLKENIKPLNYGLQHIKELNAVQYSFKSDQSNAVRLGLLAQEIEQVIQSPIGYNTLRRLFGFLEKREPNFQQYPKFP